MDDFDVFSSQPSTTKSTNSHETENEGSSWLIEGDSTTDLPSDQIPSSEEPVVSNEEPPIASNDDQFEISEPLYTLPPTTLDDNPFKINEQPQAVPDLDQFETDEQSNAVVEDSAPDYSSYEPPEDKSNFDIFATEVFSPLQAVLKKREEEIAAKDAEENRKMTILREQAKADLENWYNERQRQMEQKFRQNKLDDNDSNKKLLEKSSKQSCDWTKVVRLIDFTDGKQLTRSKRDVTRMKESIFNAKRISDKEKLANGN